MTQNEMMQEMEKFLLDLRNELKSLQDIEDLSKQGEGMLMLIDMIDEFIDEYK